MQHTCRKHSSCSPCFKTLIRNQKLRLGQKSLTAGKPNDKDACYNEYGQKFRLLITFWVNGEIMEKFDSTKKVKRSEIFHHQVPVSVGYCFEPEIDDFIFPGNFSCSGQLNNFIML